MSGGPAVITYEGLDCIEGMFAAEQMLASRPLVCFLHMENGAPVDERVILTKRTVCSASDVCA